MKSIYQFRRVSSSIQEDLKTKMVFLSGPRQCGKTTLGMEILNQEKGQYYNWDISHHKKILKALQMDEKTHFWFLDEIHKDRAWKSWLKGVYDLHHANHSLLVTGSARLDLFRRGGGDSLQGRYYLHRIHPFTLSEYLKIFDLVPFLEVPLLSCDLLPEAFEGLKSLFQLGGFPEPLFQASEKKAARWRLLYGNRLIQEEIRTVEEIKHLSQVELLWSRLPHLVGSVLSINSLREDLGVAFATVQNWLQVLENFYGCFRLAPFGPARIKAVKKEQKLYLWDWSAVESLGARFENLIAFHLLRWVHWLEDTEGEKVELRYFRNVLGQEVDFILVRKGKPWIAIEAKLEDRPLDPNLKYFLERMKTEYAFQLSLFGKQDYRVPDIQGSQIRLLPAARFLSHLP